MSKPFERAKEFACGNGHYVMAWENEDEGVDLTGFMCPICLGRIIGHENLIDLTILAPVQSPSGHEAT